MTVEIKLRILDVIPMVGSRHLTPQEQLVAKSSNGVLGSLVHDLTVTDGDTLRVKEQQSHHLKPADSAIRVITLHGDHINKAHLVLEGSGRLIKRRVHWHQTK